MSAGTTWLVSRADVAAGGGGLVRLVHPLLPDVSAAILGADGLRLHPRVPPPDPLPRAHPEEVGPFLVRLLGLVSFLKWRGLGVAPRDLLALGAMPGSPRRPWLAGPPVPEWRAVSPALAAAVTALRIAGRRLDGTSVAELREAVTRALASGPAPELASVCFAADRLRRRPELLLHEVARLAGPADGVGPDLLGLAVPSPAIEDGELVDAAGPGGPWLARGAARRRPGEGSFVEAGPSPRLEEGAVLRTLASVLSGDPRGGALERRARGGRPGPGPLPAGPPLSVVGRDVARWDPRSRAAWEEPAWWSGVTRIEVRGEAPEPWESRGARRLESTAEAVDASALVYLPFASLAESVGAWEALSREARGDVAKLVDAARRLAATFEPGAEPGRPRARPRRVVADRHRSSLALLARLFSVDEAVAVTALPRSDVESLLWRAVADGELEESGGRFAFRDPARRVRRAAALSRAERSDAIARLEELGLPAAREVPARLARGDAADREAAVALLAELVSRDAREDAADLLSRAPEGEWLDAPLVALGLMLASGHPERARAAAEAVDAASLDRLPRAERRRLLRALVRAGATERALALAGGDDAASRLVKARLLLDAHRDDEAARCLDPASGAADGLEVEAALLRAEREGRRGRYAAAARSFARVARLLPGLVPGAAREAASTAGALATDLGRYEEALAFFRLARDAASDDGERADASCDMAVALQHAGRLADAEKALGEALARYAAAGERDRYLTALGNRVDLALARGDVALARRDLVRVLEHDRAPGREHQLLFALPSAQLLALLDADLASAAAAFAEAEAAGARRPDHPAWRDLLILEARRLLIERAPERAESLLTRASERPDNRMRTEAARQRLVVSAALDRHATVPRTDFPPEERCLLEAERRLLADRAPDGAVDAATRLLERHAASPEAAPEVVLRVVEWAGRFPGRVPEGLRALGERVARGLGLDGAAARLAPSRRSEPAVPPEAVDPGAHVAEDASTVEVFRLIARVARSRLTVLVLGPTGSGKEIVARELHRLSGRTGWFVPVNMAALVTTLAESELFGHVRGAFSGADRDRIGLVESASGGTLFLDEVGDLPPALQPKLLRVLQERELSRVGEVKVRRVDLRVVAATHRDLSAMVEAGTFRADLYQRLKAFEVTLEPLRQRPRDLEALMNRLLDGATLEPEARRLLRAYPWPGNVRELVSALESARALAPSRRIDVEHLPPAVRLAGVSAAAPSTYRDGMRAAKRRLLEEALAACGGNRTRAAQRLRIARQTLVAELRALGIV